MSAAMLFAALAAISGLLAVWEAIGAVDPRRVAAFLRRFGLPLLKIGADGQLPTKHQRRQLVVTGVAAGATVGYLISGPIIALLTAAAGPVLAVVGVKLRRRRFRSAVRVAAPDLARSIADALHGGRSLRSAIVQVSDSMTGAGGVTLRRVANRLDHGSALEQVLIELRDDLKLPEIDTLIAAMLIQRDSGGDLATLLRELADALEERRRLRGDVATATAQARYTAILVGAVPLGAILLAELAKPGYVESVLAKPIALILVVMSGITQMFGFFLIRKLAKVG